MILIDKPYVSKFLIETLSSYNLPVIATSTAKELIKNEKINWISESEAIKLVKENPTIPIYSNSENAISWVEENLKFSNRPKEINLFKNKLKLRETIKELFPNYFFKGLNFSELETTSVENFKFPCILKPTVGFFSLGVHKVSNFNEWTKKVLKIKSEITEIKKYYPNGVVNTNHFIAEECIEGEEFAVDCYFNADKKPIILNITHHLFSSGDDVSDRVYSTSTTIIKTYLEKVQLFMEKLAEKVNLTNFPIHIEIRIDKNGKIIPIEVNPLRFGGWCTTADLAYHAYGFNAYHYFLTGQKPDWDKIFKESKNKIYSLVALDNNSGIPNDKVKSFDYDLLLEDFENPIEMRKISIVEHAIFGILFTETSEENKQELKNILTSNLKKYITA
ncbi:MAG: ATP-grasp domain-containing protein [Lutibacter sp.]|uniref:ATP-grasp domain-containing protein n=1 Tax=Lutibacter sp. TaxID=1925666 RepID=UPI00299F4FAC|nr:ATP-grasp domain-containing protein [Lutibacter sp.]MDX1828251.1 ATP-grasp domain-containing protein [Lutibacter sp.]